MSCGSSTGAAAPRRSYGRSLRYLFPDHWSFLLGEVALYAFIVLVATGIYLTFFFVDSTHQIVYHGPYVPLQGQRMSEAYKSVLDISTTVKAGLLIRQTHHWAANIFLAAIILHLFRVFFTGAFRKPRDLTWLIGVTMLVFALLEAFVGYTLVDDLMSGMGLVIGYSVGLAIPSSARASWVGSSTVRSRDTTCSGHGSTSFICCCSRCSSGCS